MDNNLIGKVIENANEIEEWLEEGAAEAIEVHPVDWDEFIEHIRELVQFVKDTS